jgi:hypothetical protein
MTNATVKMPACDDDGGPEHKKRMHGSSDTDMPAEFAISLVRA